MNTLKSRIYMDTHINLSWESSREASLGWGLVLTDLWPDSFTGALGSLAQLQGYFRLYCTERLRTKIFKDIISFQTKNQNKQTENPLFFFLVNLRI